MENKQYNELYDEGLYRELELEIISELKRSRKLLETVIGVVVVGISFLLMVYYKPFSNVIVYQNVRLPILLFILEVIALFALFLWGPITKTRKPKSSVIKTLAKNKQKAIQSFLRHNRPGMGEVNIYYDKQVNHLFELKRIICFS